MIEMTPIAAEKLRELRGTDPSRAFLRMYVAGKSCCSTQFGLAFDASPDEKDTVSDVAGIPLAVDPVSQPYADDVAVPVSRGKAFPVREHVVSRGHSRRARWGNHRSGSRAGAPASARSVCLGTSRVAHGSSLNAHVI